MAELHAPDPPSILRYALSLPNGSECGDPRFLLELAERAEAAGWDAVFLEDYISYQGDPRGGPAGIFGLDPEKDVRLGIVPLADGLLLVLVLAAPDELDAAWLEAQPILESVDL